MAKCNSFQPGVYRPPLLSPTGSETPLSPSMSLHSQESVTDSISSELSEDQGNTELHCACMDFDKKYVSQLLNSGASVARTNKRDRSCLHEMMLTYLSLDIIEQADQYKKMTDIIALLVTNDMDINMGDFKYQTPLHYVVRHAEQADVIRALTSSGMCVNLPDRTGLTCLHMAMPLGNLQNTEALMEAGAEPNVKDKTGTTPLHMAAKGQHHVEVIETLLNCGAHSNVTNCAMKTPLHFAAKWGRHDVINILLRAGADVMARDHSGMTPLHLAAGNDMTGCACVALLQWRGVKRRRRAQFDIDALDEVNKETPLHRAVRMKMYLNIRSLVNSGARVDIQDVRGDSVLHKATKLREIGAWKYLIGMGHPQRHGRLQNCHGLTPFQLAAKEKNHVAMNMMREYGLFD